LEERLARLEVAIHELERLRRMYSPDDVYRNRHLDWALRYGLLEAIQIVIDVSCHLAARRNLGTPANYAECIRLLRKAGLLDEALASALVRMVGLRNILVHEYATLMSLAYMHCWIKLMTSGDLLNRFILFSEAS
jgi:uncharacterized protein YutE (UPF0331/DUF86 family)